jgi:type IV pilus assembly protein PilE
MTSKPDNHSRARAKGFTLIELIVAVAIVAILAGVALPAYQNYVRRGHLQDAFTTLSDMRVKLEQYYQDNKRYGSADAATTCPTLPGYAAFPATNQYFRFDCGPGSNNATPLQTFSLTATGTGGTTTGYDYSLNDRGTKGTTKFANSTSSAACWLSKTTTCDN